MTDEIPPGTLDMLILQTLSRNNELHGFEIAANIQRVSGDILQVEEGSLLSSPTANADEGLAYSGMGQDH
jgi:DNA-binding PadR family transcriptional regulator